MVRGRTRQSNEREEVLRSFPSRRHSTTAHNDQCTTAASPSYPHRPRFHPRTPCMSSFAATELSLALSELGWGLQSWEMLPIPGTALLTLLEAGQTVTVQVSEEGWRVLPPSPVSASPIFLLTGTHDWAGVGGRRQDVCDAGCVVGERFTHVRVEEDQVVVCFAGKYLCATRLGRGGGLHWMR
jgi:hypothetical protein